MVSGERHAYSRESGLYLCTEPNKHAAKKFKAVKVSFAASFCRVPSSTLHGEHQYQAGLWLSVFDQAEDVVGLLRNGWGKCELIQDVQHCILGNGRVVFSVEGMALLHENHGMTGRELGDVGRGGDSGSCYTVKAGEEVELGS